MTMIKHFDEEKYYWNDVEILEAAITQYLNQFKREDWTTEDYMLHDILTCQIDRKKQLREVIEETGILDEPLRTAMKLTK